ncbi:MAG: TlpA family protein disulfide reductase [Acidobacteria bacterium]|nr:TlpA family protein disulfide reductase [Acidobacteriota bacterium]
MLKFVKGAILFAGLAVLFLTFGPSAVNPFAKLSKSADRRSIDAFALPAMDGSEWSLGAHQGQVVLLNFWATWCPPCRAETPALVNVHNELSGRGFSVVGVSMDDDPASAVPGFVEKYKISYPILKPEGFPLANHIDTLPTSLLLDKHGRVARTYTGMIPETVLRRDVEALLSES